ncbi:Protein of unknown function [Cupriavidus sp. YR651]|uniref:DUF1484 family protein n=1 Tax=Cupriavidus sp. YR651 TaxID=1855315 RepID=UPI0008844D0B|nr:DUF1484 family protein [Cupriavidus sp. YR651]SDC10233.1 Protein of unknown function [Cupriavidus sp. YR651]
MHKAQHLTGNELAFFRQRDMLSQLVSQILPTNRRSKAELSSAVAQINALSESIRGATQNSCYELLRVSAGLEGILRLLDLESDRSPTHLRLHCMLSPLKKQLDEALSHVHDML